MIRLVFQLKTYRRFSLDDYLLCFATICLTVTTVLAYTSISVLYLKAEVIYNPKHILILLADLDNVAKKVNHYHKFAYSYPALPWASIFGIKFAYLAFF